jgi:hypothetical protein
MVTEMDSKELNKRKNTDYQQFLNVTNRKPAIFRDIIIESEYDPLEPNRQSLKAQTMMLNDPVRISQIKAYQEASMLTTTHSNNNNPTSSSGKSPLGKDTLNVELWAAGKIEATPYGSFAKLMKSTNHTNNGNQEQQKSKTMQSHIFFDHYTFPKGRDVIDAEMPKGKRIVPQLNVGNPGDVFGNLPPDFKKELSSMKLLESRNPLNY